MILFIYFFFSSRRRHTRSLCDWSSDVCSSDLKECRCERPTQHGTLSSPGPARFAAAARALSFGPLPPSPFPARPREPALERDGRTDESGGILLTGGSVTREVLRLARQD